MNHGREIVTLQELPPLGGGDPQRPRRLAAAAEAYGAEHPDVYAGLFFSAGYIYVGFISDPERHLSAIRRRVNDPEGVRAFRADYTSAQIAETSERLSADFSSLQEAGIPITGVGPDEYHNRVNVSLARRDAQQETELRERYGQLLSFQDAVFLHGPRLRSKGNTR